MKLKSVPGNYVGVIFEVTTLQEYRDYRNSKTGYFLIIDSANPYMIHPVDDNHQREDTFKEKVVDNQRKYGQYFYSKDLNALKDWSDASTCYRIL